MVAGHYQPLADGDAIELPTPCVARPNLSSAVESEDKDKQSQVGPGLRFSSAPCGIACLRPLQPKRSGRCPDRTTFALPRTASRRHLRRRLVERCARLRHFTSTFAPASSSFFFAASASALLM